MRDIELAQKAFVKRENFELHQLVHGKIVMSKVLVIFKLFRTTKLLYINFHGREKWVFLQIFFNNKNICA